MKRFILFFCLLFVCFVSYAQEYDIPEAVDPLRIEVVQGKIISEDLKRTGSVVIEFLPAYDEARFVYRCPTPLFEQSSAMLAIKEAVSSFVKERGYYYYTYLKSDDTRFDPNSQSAIYTSYIQLLH